MTKFAACRILVAGTVLATASLMAVGAELRPMSDAEMAGVSGQGMVAPIVLASMSLSEQQATYASANGVQATLATMTNESANQLSRMMAQQQAQTASVGLQQTIQMTQTLAKMSAVAAALPVSLPAMALPGLLGGLGGVGAVGAVGALGSLGALGGLNGLTTQSQPQPPQQQSGKH